MNMLEILGKLREIKLAVDELISVVEASMSEKLEVSIFPVPPLPPERHL